MESWGRTQLHLIQTAVMASRIVNTLEMNLAVVGDITDVCRLINVFIHKVG